MGRSPASGHDRGSLGDPQIRLPQDDTVFSCQGGQHDDGLVHQLGVGRMGHVLGLDRRIDRDPLQVAGLQGVGGMGHPQALGQQQLQAIAEPPAPVAQPRALMRDLVLEVGFAGEVLEIGIVHPTLPDALIREPVDLLQEQDPDHEAGLGPGPSLGGETLRHLLVDPVPVDLLGQPNQLMLHIDDLIETGSKEVACSLLLALLRSHPMTPLQGRKGITRQPKTESKIARKQRLKPRSPAIAMTSMGRKNPQTQRTPRSSRTTTQPHPSHAGIEHLGCRCLHGRAVPLVFFSDHPTVSGRATSRCSCGCRW